MKDKGEMRRYGDNEGMVEGKEKETEGMWCVWKKGMMEGCERDYGEMMKNERKSDDASLSL